MTRSTQPGLRFRTRKLAPKNLLPVLREDQIDSDEYKELVDNHFKVETGVEKSEENEYHLQQALANALGRGNKGEAQKIVPAPPAEESKEINYDELYKLTFTKSSSYIRFSQTVEECTGCQYDMTSEDDVFLKTYNQTRSAASQCSEDDFEKIMEVFETTAARQAPFAAVDQTVVAYDTMETILKMEIDKKAQVFTKDIYEYWRTRRQVSGNRSLQPTLKFELHQDSDDGDPYVCFRRRDVRLTRKTRARDFQVTDKLKKLRLELEEGRKLVQTVVQREDIQRELLATVRKVFEMRAKLKDVRQQLGIKVDDEDLINQKPQKKKPVEVPQIQRPSGNQIRLPNRSDGRPLEADLTQLEDLKDQRQLALEQEIQQKLAQHQKWNLNHVDFTMDPLMERPVPVESNWRTATTQYLLTPPASLSEESSQDQASETANLMKSFSRLEEAHTQVSFRRRFGRNGRMWIDRRGLPPSPISDMDDIKADQWKYDQDSDDEMPDYVMDPFSIEALKFRAMIPGPSPRRGIPNEAPRPPNGIPVNVQQTPNRLTSSAPVPTQRPA